MESLEINQTCNSPLILPTLLNLSSTGSNVSISKTDKETITAAWLYGLMTAVAMALLPVFGFVFQPLLKQKWYGDVVIFFAAQTASHVVSMAFLVYLPKATKFDLLLGKHNQAPGERVADERRLLAFVYVMAAVFVILFLGFNLEIFHRQAKMAKLKRRFSSRSLSAHNNDNNFRDQHSPVKAVASSSNYQPNNGVATVTRSRSNTPDQPYPVRIFDDVFSASPLLFIAAECLITFIDGVRVGSAISSGNFVRGVAVAFVVLTEEIPRKIGGIAILQCAGSLTICQAVGCSLIPSCFLIAGFFGGAFLCSVIFKLFAPWCYAIAAGFYLHVAFIVTMPQLLRCILFPIKQRLQLRSDTTLIVASSSPFNQPPDDQEAGNNTNNSNNVVSSHSNKRRRFCTCRCLVSNYISRLFVVDLGFIIGYSISSILCFYAETLPYMASY